MVLAALAAITPAVVPAPEASAAAVGATTVGAATVSPGGSGGTQDAASLQAQESAVLMQIAELSDRVDRVQSSLVGVELAHTAAVSEYRRMHTAVVDMVVQAYMHHAPVGGAPSDAPAAYVDVAASAAGRLVTRYAAESRSYAAAEAGYERSLSGLHSDQTRLEAQQQALDVLVSAAQAAAERRRSADAAALAASDAARRQASGGDVAFRAGHAAATAAQAAVLARYPFGPLAEQSGPALPPSLRPVGPALSGVASWYGPGFDGQPTATGAIYDENAWTVASPDLPLGTMLVVSSEGRSVLLLVNDRGPYVPGRILDLSHAGAEALGFDGLATVTAQVVAPVS
ncbi:MAG TPA: septal ring lytic transglycosylase RlpA family protein [Acidimicrobiales bacterium]|nr:septal ring lytic transglycosylase RlpA family protein [Acidimicrobiales bacterium]